jgi:hypothetical protein
MMNPYSARGQAKIQIRDINSVLHSGSFQAAAALAALEQRRAWQAEAELECLLQAHGFTPQPDPTRLAALRQALGAALIRAGERLAGVPACAVPPEVASTASTLGTVG